jgi:hypothetical protein
MRLAIIIALVLPLIYPMAGKAAGQAGSHATNRSATTMSQPPATSTAFSPAKQSSRAQITLQLLQQLPQGARPLPIANQSFSATEGSSTPVTPSRARWHPRCLGSEWSADGQHHLFQSGCDPDARQAMTARLFLRSP